MRARLGMLLALAAVQAAVLVLAHSLVYLARYGSRYGEALIHSGHGDGWRAAATTSVVLGVIVTIGAIGRLISLRIKLRGAQAGNGVARLEVIRLVRLAVVTGMAFAFATAALLTVQENLEQPAFVAGPTGIGILLSPEYAGGLWIALAVGAAVGIVVALFAWRVAVLEARLRAARHAAAHRRPGRAPRPATRPARPVTSILGRRSALRAPPAMGAA